MNLGQHVVCINAEFHPEVEKLYTELPREGSAYVIRDIRLGIRVHPIREGDVSLLLVGLNNPRAGRLQLERGFSQDRFVPLDEHRRIVKEIETEMEKQKQEMAEG